MNERMFLQGYSGYYFNKDHGVVEKETATGSFVVLDSEETQALFGPKQETDPTGKSQHEMGAKLDEGKPRMDLVLSGFARALTEVAKVGTFGATKYADNSWIHVSNGIQRYADAGLRHHFERAKGELYDSQTKLDHAAHKAWNALAELDLILREREK